MNTTDEIAISAIFAEAKTLNEVKKKTSAEYVNLRIRDYAIAVLENHNRIKSELLTALRKNYYVLGERVELPAEGFINIDNKIIFGDCKINIRCHLRNPSNLVVKSWYCSSGKIVTPSENIVFDDIWWYTSDTSDPDRKICSAWRLDNHAGISDEDGKGISITKGIYDDTLSALKHETFTEKQWQQIYGQATWTEAYTRKFVEHFKKFIENRVAMLRGSVNADLDAKKKNESVNNNGTRTTTVNITWTI